MTGSISLLSNLEKLLGEVEDFNSYKPTRQAAFRARVTRYMATAKEVGDTDSLAILEVIQETVGKAERPKSKKLTIDEKLAAYQAEMPDFKGLDNRRRAAFRAKLSRLTNEADEAGRDDLINSLNTLYLETEKVQRTEIRERIAKEAAKLRKSLKAKSDKKSG